ncbi:MAG TPA: MFS transporter [Acidimicrobiia bacterium]|nr:MFS transporter [Acidimicrobiia bacterium]
MTARRSLTAFRQSLRNQEQVVAVSISTMLVMMGQGILGPVLPLFTVELGFGAAAAGAAVGAFALARLLFNVPLGALSDTRGRRLLIVVGPAVVAVGMIGSGLASGLLSLIVWRFIAGLGSSMYMTGSLAYVVDIATPGNRTRLLAVNQAALLVGVAIGPWLGGFVGARFGLRAPFFVVAAAALAAAVYAYLRMPETLPESHTNSDDQPKQVKAESGMRSLLTVPFIAIAFVSFAQFLTRGTSPQALIPLAGAETFSMDVDTIGLLLGAMALMSLLLLPAASTAADRRGRARVIVPSLWIVAASLAVIGSASTVAVFVIGSLVLGFGNAVSGPAPAAYAAEVSSAQSRGLAMGAFRTAGDLGLLIGPPVLGAVADSNGYHWAFWVNSGIVAAAAVILGLATRGRPRPPAG